MRSFAFSRRLFSFLYLVCLLAIDATANHAPDGHVNVLANGVQVSQERAALVNAQYQRRLSNDDSNNGNDRGLVCHMVAVDVWYEDENTEEQNNNEQQKSSDHGAGKQTDDEYDCTLEDEDGELSSEYFNLPDLPHRVKEAFHHDCDVNPSCDFTILIPGGSIDITNDSVVIPDPSAISIVEGSGRRQRRNLAPRSGNLRVLIVRVIDIWNTPHLDCGVPADHLLDLYFSDSTASLKTQYQRCSRGKLNLQPASPTPIVDVEVNINTTHVWTSRDTVLNMATRAAQTKLEVRNLNYYAHLVIYCFPPMPRWVAYAIVGGYQSSYKAIWSTYLTVQMHEVGHNFGLYHTFKLNDEGVTKAYQERSGVMGGAVDGSHTIENGPLMCFDPASFGQLGWHSDLTYYPRIQEKVGLPMVAFVDHDLAIPGVEYTHIRTNIHGFDHHIHYNGNWSYNSGTYESRNQLVITRYQPWNPQRGTHFVAAIDPVPGAYYQQPLDQAYGYGSTYWRVEICEVHDITPRLLGVYVGGVPHPVYSFCNDDSVQAQFILENRPTSSPIAGPSVSPTTSPAAYVTASPTSTPTISPTESPTSSPTTSPSADPTTNPTTTPTASPTIYTSQSPTSSPTASPTSSPTASPTTSPTVNPTSSPTTSPTVYTTQSPTSSPTDSPTASPTISPTDFPSAYPTISPTDSPTASPTISPTDSPTASPTTSPSLHPTVSSAPSHSPAQCIPRDYDCSYDADGCCSGLICRTTGFNAKQCRPDGSNNNDNGGRGVDGRMRGGTRRAMMARKQRMMMMTMNNPATSYSRRVLRGARGAEKG